MVLPLQDRPALTEAEASRLREKVQALLDSDRLSEAVSLLEDSVQRAGQDSVLELRLCYLLGAALFYAGEYTRAASLFDAAGRAYRRFLPPNDPHVAQMLATAGEADEALSELEAVRVLVADSFGTSSTQLRNLDKQISRLPSRGKHSSLKKRQLRRRLDILEKGQWAIVPGDR